MVLPTQHSFCLLKRSHTDLKLTLIPTQMHAPDRNLQSHKQLQVPDTTSPTAFVIHSHPCLSMPIPMRPFSGCPYGLPKSSSFEMNLALVQEPQSTHPQTLTKACTPGLTLSAVCLNFSMWHLKACWYVLKDQWGINFSASVPFAVYCWNVAHHLVPCVPLNKS